MENTQKLNSSNYEQIYYVDSINGNDKDGNGSKENPYKSLENLFKNIKDFSKNTLINLGKGEYKTVLKMFDNNNNCTFTIKGKNKKTILNQHQRVGESRGDGIGGSNYFLNIFNLIYTSNINDTNTIVISCNLNFYNILIKDIPDANYGYFLPCNSTINFYNCTKTNISSNFLRKCDGKTNLYNCYGAFTSGYYTKQSDWDIKNNLITNIVNLDSIYKIIGSDNSLFGVYSGENSWGNNKFLIKQNDNYYAIKSNFYQLGQPKDESELVEWYEKCGVDDPNEIMKPIDNQEVSMSKDDKDIWTTDIPIDFNKVADDIELVENDDRKSIKYGCKTYRIYDLLDDEFQFIMSEDKDN